MKKHYTVTAEIEAVEFSVDGNNYYADATYQWTVDAYQFNGRYWGNPDLWTEPEADYDKESEGIVKITVTTVDDDTPLTGGELAAVIEHARKAIADAASKIEDETVWEAWDNH